MWRLGLLLLVPAVFGGVVQQQVIKREGCSLPDGRFFTVGKSWNIATADGPDCGAYCTCQGVNSFGCVGCPLVQMAKPQAPPLAKPNKRTMTRDKREVEVTCEYNGKTYHPGDSVTAADGCNTCFCSGSGGMGCTMMYCIQGCYWNGRIFNVGDTFHDGCGVCRCEPRNKINCSVDSCLPVTGNRGRHDFGDAMVDIQEPEKPAL